MNVQKQNSGVSPQAKGRELARLGRELWQESTSVRAAAAELMSRFPEVPSFQAHRYACGLSQNQAAERYNATTDHRTTLGNTTINSWESWARRAGGSPPPFSSLLVLAEAYGRGPLGVGEEDLSPADLVSDCYEWLLPEDQISLRRYSAGASLAPRRAHVPPALNDGPGSGTVLRLTSNGNVLGTDFPLEVPTVQYGNPWIRPLTLPNPRPGLLLNLTWETFGLGIGRLIQQVKNLGARLDVDVCFGINEAGLVMATFLASAQFDRCPIGYLKCNKSRDSIWLDDASFFPEAKKAPTIVLCDFEVKHADNIGFLTGRIRERYPEADIYFAVFGAMTKDLNLEVASFDDLTGAGIMRKASFAAVFIAATMSPPGIEPPLELR